MRQTQVRLSFYPKSVTIFGEADPKGGGNLQSDRLLHPSILGLGVGA
jgi:hypothetical protein